MQTNQYQKLLDILKPYGKICISYSGGVDSTFLAYSAIDALGADNVLCVLIKGYALPEREYNNAVNYAKAIGANLEILEVNEFEIEQFAANTAQRCYYCKKFIFSHIFELMQKRGFSTLACGSNIDDLDDYRPGNQAVKECNVAVPLIEAGFDKSLIRKISRELSLPTADNPSSPCLASRVPYQEHITPDILRKIDQAEQFLANLGFGELRVRCSHSTAKIEIKPEKFGKAISSQSEIVERLEKIGFTYITLDLKGFRSGAMNEQLLKQKL